MVDYVVFFGLVSVGFVLLWMDKRRHKGIEPAGYVPPFMEELGKCESPIERSVLKSLWLRNHQVVAQYPVGRYRLDLAIPALMICIECDGKAWHSSAAQKAHDRKRDAYLKSQGWKVLRFTGRQINRNVGLVIKRIESEVNKKHSY
ncbi:DUF559 domain-containing protein [Peribacillus castrilensis]|uniref:endonuclease domain-containing protein n=1 Tax=Peribacillus castrilensis TaxID=2897690 RepID=UPI003D2E5E48